MTKLNIRFEQYFESIHLYQLYSGFGLLEENGKIACVYEPTKSYSLHRYGPSFLKITLNDRIKIAYDMGDGDGIISEILDWCDFYFKRSYSQDPHGKISEKIQPLGLYYLVYGPNMSLTKRLSKNYPSIKRNKLTEIVKLQALHSRKLSSILSFKGGSSVNWYKKFEGVPNLQKDPKIIFMTQVWKPKPRADRQILEERLDINKMRCECISLLRKEFPGQFYGGIYPDEYALAVHRAFVITDERVFHKKNYLTRMHASDIGIATMGLFGSNGGKLGEYVAGAKSIVSEKLRYQVPGDFCNGHNYLEFSTPEECVAQVQKLVDDSELRHAMMKHNHEYYLASLRPDMLIWNSLQRALELYK